MNYDKAEFGMHVSDANALGVLLTNTKSLSNLSLRESLLNDELMGVLAKGLVNNQTLTSLDLSHNQLGDEAARRLSAHLEQENVLISLNLSDNSVIPMKSPEAAILSHGSAVTDWSRWCRTSWSSPQEEHDTSRTVSASQQDRRRRRSALTRGFA